MTNDWKPEKNISSPWDVDVRENNIEQAKEDGVFVIPENTLFIQQPKQSNWTCYMFGNRPGANYGITYTPVEGRVPNRFVRWMMYLCFDSVWVKEK
jgi:hypothetical protein